MLTQRGQKSHILNVLPVTSDCPDSFNLLSPGETKGQIQSIHYIESGKGNHNLKGYL